MKRLEPSCYFPPESELAELILGKGRLAEWRALAEVQERHGLPKIDDRMGGRYWPAVKRYFDSINGVITIEAGSIGPPDGGESCPSPKPKRRDSSNAPAATVHQFTTGAREKT